MADDLLNDVLPPPFPLGFLVLNQMLFFFHTYVKIIDLIKRSLKKRMILQLHSTNLTYCSCIPKIECFEKNLIFVEESVPLPYRITSKEKCYYFCEMVPTCMVSDHHSCKSCKRFSCDFSFQFFVWVEEEEICGLRFYEPNVLINTTANTEEGRQYDLAFEYQYRKSLPYGTFGTGKICIMAFPVVEFSRQGYKIRKVFG